MRCDVAFERRIIPESVRWMITAGKIDEATEELKCIAKHNGKKLSDESLKMLETFKNANEKAGIEIVNMRSSFPDDILVIVHKLH